jgi:hypothetical protein
MTALHGIMGSPSSLTMPLRSKATDIAKKNPKESSTELRKVLESK